MIEINIDGQEVKSPKGRTILEAARAYGISIPTLCYDERVKPYGGCGLCMVEIEGSPKLFRACATEISPGMVIKTDTPRIRDSRRATLEFLLSEHTGDCQGPCVKACPAHNDVQGYVGLIANGQYEEALQLIKEKIPLPASIGRICPHPCETACRRQLVEEPVAIAALKYFAADIDLKKENPFMPEIKAATGKKVAIVGAGPAGLTAAYYLAIEGHQIKVYDAMPQGGGMLRYGIPEYRLPKAVLDREIDLIERMGVGFVYNTRVGTDIRLEELARHNDAVFLGIGAWSSSEMRAKGEDLPGILGGIDFLREIALQIEVQIGETVAVVGGGNTAMDAARTALRLGARKVMVLYRRTRAEMPAEELEIKEAEEEGIEFRFLVAPLEILARDGKAAAIRLQKMELGETDASGRRSPVPIPGAEEIITADTIISAIGQKVDPEGLTGLRLNRRGGIEVAEDTLATDIPGIFAGGDGVTGPQIAVDAVAQGGRAARSIDRYLNGSLEAPKDKYTAERKGLTRADFADYPRETRVSMARLHPEERRRNFREINLGFKEAEAAAEAGRCLECGCQDYFECRLLQYANDYEADPRRVEGEKRRGKFKDTHPFIERNPEKCILCGLCVRICDEFMGVTALGLVNRGFETVVRPAFDLPLEETSCISCGQCVAVCPTGALMEKFPVPKKPSLQMRETYGTCSFCGMGCETRFYSRGNIIYKARPAIDGLLCLQGRFAFAAFAHDRIVKPMIKANGRFSETTWTEALTKAARHSDRIKRAYSGSALAVCLSPAFTLEEAAAAADFARLALGTDKLGSAAPYAARGLARILNGRILTGDLDELANTEVILLAGSLNYSQVGAVKIRAAVKAGARLMIISPEPTMVDDLAAVIIRETAGYDTLINMLAAAVKNNWAAEDFIAGFAEGYDRFKKELLTREPGSEAQEAAEAFAQARKAMIVVDGSEVTEAGVELLADLALITGRIGSPSGGMIVITPGGNHLGLWKLGITGSAANLKAGLSEGTVKGLFILNEDPAGAGILDKEELRRLELLVVATPYMNPTAESADIILPSSVPVETAGTYISADGKIKTLNRVVSFRSGLGNQEIIRDLAAGMKTPLDISRQKEMVRAAMKTQEALELSGTKASLSIPAPQSIFAAAPVPDPALRKFYQMCRFNK